PSPPDEAANAYNIHTARRSESPSATSRCDAWSRPPCEIARPDIRLCNVTRVVSKIGMTKINTGAARTDNRLRDRPVAPAELRSAVDARKNPMNIEPESPMKIEAGLEL